MIKDLLAIPPQRAIIQDIVALALNNMRELSALVSALISKDVRVSQRASKPLGDEASINPQAIFPYIDQLMETAKQPQNNGSRRNVIRVFQYMNLFPEEKEGSIYELCLEYAGKASEAIAVKAFAPDVCVNTACRHNELLAEVLQLMEIMEADDSPAVQSSIKS
jgi:hypothetical protein